MSLTSRRIALPAAALVALAALTGCGATTATAAVTAAPAKLRVPAAVVVKPARPTTPAPTLTTTGTTWPKVVGSLITYGQWLLANPNPGLAATVTVPGCAAADGLTAELQSYLQQRAYVQPAAPVLTSITGPVGSAVGGEVTVDIQAVRGAEPIYERATARSTTHVLADRPELPPTVLSLGLIRGSDARWRICTVTADQNPGTDALGALL